jgi:glutaryl-CoA dehydrogenase
LVTAACRNVCNKNDLVSFAKQRTQFNRPIASFQLVQQKLVTMVTELSLAQVLSIHIAWQKDAGQATPAMISMLKLTSSRSL